MDGTRSPRLADTCDVLVIGGGAAGCVLAARLSEDRGRRVVLLEAGPDLRADPPFDVRDASRPTMGHDWGYAEVPGPDGHARPLPRGKLLGGCSATNAVFALRGHPADYDDWARAGNPGWSFADVLPSFVRLERDTDFGDEAWHGREGPLPITRIPEGELSDVARAGQESLELAGLERIPDANEPGRVGVSTLPRNSADGVRVSTALAYLPAPGQRDNLTVRCDAEVARLEFRRTRATGALLTTGEVVRTDLVVLAAGAYGSPAILLRSGVGPAAHLSALGIPGVVDLPGVGANLADHPAVSIDLPYPHEVQPVPVFQIVATFHSEGRPPTAAPDLQCVVGGPYADGTFFLGAALLKPRSRGTVRLRDPDPGVPPLIDLGYYREPGDLDRLLEGFRRVRAAAAAGPVVALTAGEVGRPPPDAELPDWVRRSTWTYHHPVGTCAMGPDPRAGAVVDAVGRVHGIEGLVVADASVMPDLPSANTHIPTVMVAEHVAAFLTGSTDDPTRREHHREP